MYLLVSTRDVHTVWWLDKVVEPVIVNNYWENEEEYFPGDHGGNTYRENDQRMGSKLLNYHGLSALNTTLYPEWDSFFNALLDKPDAILEIETPNFMSFEIEIEPARLCARILSVREQIAREMAADCKAINSMGHYIFCSYQENSQKRTNIKKVDEHGDFVSKPKTFDSPSALYINFDQRDDEALAPSPLRKGNFDLLYNLLTQQAIIELLNSEDGVVVGEDPQQNQACREYLYRFYLQRFPSTFEGSQWYGKSDAFVEELMLSSPLFLTMNLESGTGVEQSETQASSRPPLEVEPLRVAEQILLKRDNLALEWMDIMSSVPSDHTEIRRMQLNRLTGVPIAGPQSTTAISDEFQ